MRTLVFDGRMGASGDMILGALLAAGADRDALAPVEDVLDVTYDVGDADKNGIAATSVDVRLTGDGDGESDDANEHAHSHEHSYDHDHDHHHDHGGHPHDHGHGHGHGHDHGHGDHAEGAGPLRTYPEVVELVESMNLPERVESDAKAIFELLGEAEAAVHGTDIESIHFHEVGADDAVADIVGAALLVADVDPDRIVTTPVAAGDGAVEMSHGVYPVPAPAVVELAGRADWSLRGGPVEAELLTPTGAAVLAHFADGVERIPALRVARSGYGAGDREFPDHPNVLRVISGDSTDADADADDGTGRATTDATDAEGGLVRDDIAVLETNLDDAPPEVLGGLQETLADAGARDVSILPATMKKARPGHLVKVIVKPEDAQRVARRLAEETGTLGIRESGASHRWIADRAFETATLDIDGDSYEVSVKVASDTDGAVYDVSAEYDDAAAVAEATGLAIRAVMRRAEDAVR